MAAALSHSLQTRQCLPGSGRRECQFGAEEIPLILSLTFDLGFWRAFHVPEVFRLFWNIGSDSSIVTQGNLSSSQIVFCGANGVGSSKEAIVTSIASESLVSSKNKCVPQHPAKERIRFAY